METIELQLDKNTLTQARQIAAVRRATLEDLIKEIIQRLATRLLKDDPILGLFSDEPDLIDQIVESTFLARERDLLRQPNG